MWSTVPTLFQTACFWQEVHCEPILVTNEAIRGAQNVQEAHKAHTGPRSPWPLSFFSCSSSCRGTLCYILVLSEMKRKLFRKCFLFGDVQNIIVWWLEFLCICHFLLLWGLFWFHRKYSRVFRDADNLWDVYLKKINLEHLPKILQLGNNRLSEFCKFFRESTSNTETLKIFML